MAKLTARGAHKVAEASKTVTLDGSRWTTFLVLRSDGAVLVATANPDGRTAYDRKRTGYSIKGKLPEKEGRTSLERFHRYCTQRGFEVKS